MHSTAEISELVRVCEQKKTTDWNGFTFYEGVIEHRDVIIAKSGVGKSMAAMLTQKVIDHYSPKCVIFTGLAGSINPDIFIGDTVVARDCLQHDLDATALGFARGEVPYSPYRVFSCDEHLMELALSCQPATLKPGIQSVRPPRERTSPSGSGHSGRIPPSAASDSESEHRAPRVTAGRILTGDTFLVHSMMETHRYLRGELHGDAVEMEGASVGLVATVNRVPFLIIRTISDRADESAHVDFNRFLPWASNNSLRFVTHVLRKM